MSHLANPGLLRTLRECGSLRAMRAARVHEFGVENLIVEDVAEPTVASDQVLVRLHAASLNFRDLRMVAGQYDPRQPLPLIPCSDGAGVVEAVGADVKGVKPSDRVAPCFAPYWQAGEPERDAIRQTLGGPLPGTLAEKIVVPARGVVRIPESLSDEQAATLPCAAVTAWSALVTMGNLRAGETVLIQGTGGVSLFALQIAKIHGARVIATSSSDEKLERAHKLGADELINYRTDANWGKTAKKATPQSRGVDHVVEVGGGSTLEQSLRAVRTGGQIHLIGVLSGTSSKLRLLPILMNQVRVQGVLVGHRESFAALMRAVCETELAPVIDRTFELSEARAAFEHLASGTHFGKVVIRLGS